MAGEFGDLTSLDFGQGGADASMFNDIAGGSMPGSFVPPNAGGDGGGFGSWLSNFGSGAKDFLKGAGGFAKDIAPAVGLGATALGAYEGVKGGQQASQQQGVLNQAQKQMLSTGQTAASSASSLVPAGTAAVLGGPLPAGLQAEADQFKADSLAKVRAYAAHAGFTDSTMMQTMEDQVNMQYDILKEKLAESVLASGTTQESAALGPLSGAATTAQAAMGTGDSAVNAAYKSIAALMGQSGEVSG